MSYSSATVSLQTDLELTSNNCAPPTSTPSSNVEPSAEGLGSPTTDLAPRLNVATHNEDVLKPSVPEKTTVLDVRGECEVQGARPKERSFEAMEKKRQDKVISYLLEILLN